jgi:hypothetical protein
MFQSHALRRHNEQQNCFNPSMVIVSSERRKGNPMGTKEIREKYGGNNRQATNAAIRAEMVGGDNLLDALELVHRLATRLKERRLAGQDEAFEALDALTRLRELMVELVRRRYD